MTQIKFGALRLRPETLREVKSLKQSYESLYMRRFTFDEFMERLVSYVEESDPEVWEKFLQVRRRGGIIDNAK